MSQHPQRAFAYRTLFTLLIAAMFIVSGCGESKKSDISIPDPYVPTSSPTPASQLLTPAAAPGTPSALPPKISGKALAAPQAKDSVASINLKKGWNVISFPFTSVTAVKGLEYQLCQYKDVEYVHVNPVTNPAILDTSTAYWAYADKDSTIEVTGLLNYEKMRSIKLQAGWNLVGCPADKALLFKNMSVSRQGCSIRTLDEATGKAMYPTDAWMYRVATIAEAGASTAIVDLSSDKDGLQPQKGYWIFSWSEAILNTNPLLPSPLPVISKLSASSLKPGDTLTISGSGFGTQDKGMVTISGISVPNEAISAWSSNSIVLTVPSGITYGTAVVYNDLCPSEIANFTAQPGPSGSFVSVYGYVTDENEKPLANTQIMLDTGYSAVSDTKGEFNIYDVPAGQYLCYATHIGYKTGCGLINVKNGETARLRVELVTPLNGSTSGGDIGESSASLTIKAYAKETSGTNYWPYRIEVAEKGNYSNRWTSSWESRENTRELRIPNAIQGKTYNIKVSWKSDGGDKHLGSFSCKVDRSEQSVSYDNW